MFTSKRPILKAKRTGPIGGGSTIGLGHGGTRYGGVSGGSSGSESDSGGRNNVNTVNDMHKHNRGSIDSQPGLVFNVSPPSSASNSGESTPNIVVSNRSTMMSFLKGMTMHKNPSVNAVNTQSVPSVPNITRVANVAKPFFDFKVPETIQTLQLLDKPPLLDNKPQLVEKPQLLEKSIQQSQQQSHQPQQQPPDTQSWLRQQQQKSLQQRTQQQSMVEQKNRQHQHQLQQPLHQFSSQPRPIQQPQPLFPSPPQPLQQYQTQPLRQLPMSLAIAIPPVPPEVYVQTQTLPASSANPTTTTTNSLALCFSTPVSTPKHQQHTTSTSNVIQPYPYSSASSVYQPSTSVSRDTLVLQNYPNRFVNSTTRKNKLPPRSMGATRVKFHSATKKLKQYHEQERMEQQLRFDALCRPGSRHDMQRVTLYTTESATSTTICGSC